MNKIERGRAFRDCESYILSMLAGMIKDLEDKKRFLEEWLGNP